MSELSAAFLRVVPFAIVPVVFGVLLKKGKITQEVIALQLPASKTRFFLWLFGFVALTFAIEYALYCTGLLEIQKWKHASLAPTIIRIVGAVVLAPVAEELLFRGLMLGRFMEKKRVSVTVAVALQAILFVALHNFTWQNTTSSNIGIVQGLLDASLFAYARLRTGSIATPMCMHASGNLFAILERLASLAV